MQSGNCVKMALTNGTLPLTQAYVDDNWPVVRLRMQKAAVRLASVLKNLLGS
jgi:hypothetical protein